MPRRTNGDKVLPYGRVSGKSVRLRSLYEWHGGRPAIELCHFAHTRTLPHGGEGRVDL